MIADLIGKKSGHVALCGKTGSGKSVLAFALCRELMSRGELCFALDENNAEEWECEVTANHELFFKSLWAYLRNPENEFRALYKKERKPFINIFIDECGEYSVKDWSKLKTFLTRGRQFGVRVFLISQRYCLMNKTARLQCSTFIIFKQTVSDVEEIRELTGSKEFDCCAEKLFPNLHFVFMGSDCNEKFYKIVFDSRLKNGVKFQQLEKAPNFDFDGSLRSNRTI